MAWVIVVAAVVASALITWWMVAAREDDRIGQSRLDGVAPRLMRRYSVSMWSATYGLADRESERPTELVERKERKERKERNYGS